MEHILIDLSTKKYSILIIIIILLLIIKINFIQINNIEVVEVGNNIDVMRLLVMRNLKTNCSSS